MIEAYCLALNAITQNLKCVKLTTYLNLLASGYAIIVRLGITLKEIQMIDTSIKVTAKFFWRSMPVKKLKLILDKLDKLNSDICLIPNRVGNLIVFGNHGMIGYIDFNEEELELYEQANEEDSK